MRALLVAERPLLMTALSSSDAARDDRFLRELHWGAAGPPACLDEPYAENPFSSLLNASGEGLVGMGTTSRMKNRTNPGAPAPAQSGGKDGAANSCSRVLLPI